MMGECLSGNHPISFFF